MEQYIDNYALNFYTCITTLANAERMMEEGRREDRRVRDGETEIKIKTSKSKT